jgi:hypothetical protein
VPVTPAPSTLADLGPFLDINLQVPHFDVTDRRFGAKGDGVTDDTAAIQAAANAAIAAKGTLILPPLVSYKITDTINLVPTSGSVFRLNISSGSPIETAISYEGANDKSVFHSYGWKYSRVTGVNTVVPSATGVTVWDLDVDGTRTGSSYLSFANCVTDLHGINSTAWRMGHTAGGLDMSFIDWTNCPVFGFTGGSTGKIGWVWEFANALNYVWVNCYGASLSKVFTNTSTAGAGSALGGDSGFWFGCGGSSNDRDFEFKNSGVYTVVGGRWESGKKALVIGNGSTGMVVSFLGTKWASYAPGDNCVFDIANITYNGGRPISLALRNCESDGFDATAAFITFQGTATRPASLLVDGGYYRSTVDPIYTIVTQPVNVRFDTVQQVNSSLQPTALFSDPAKLQIFTKAGVPVDADFPWVQNGDLAIDTTNNKIMVRIGGVWKGVVVA